MNTSQSTQKGKRDELIFDTSKLCTDICKTILAVKLSNMKGTSFNITILNFFLGMVYIFSLQKITPELLKTFVPFLPNCPAILTYSVLSGSRWTKSCWFELVHHAGWFQFCLWRSQKFFKAALQTFIKLSSNVTLLTFKLSLFQNYVTVKTVRNQYNIQNFELNSK